MGCPRDSRRRKTTQDDLRGKLWSSKKTVARFLQASRPGVSKGLKHDLRRLTKQAVGSIEDWCSMPAGLEARGCPKDLLEQRSGLGDVLNFLLQDGGS